ncbi:MAG: helix-turn-helix domain-containing protein [Gemmatimonadota bacterium]
MKRTAAVSWRVGHIDSVERASDSLTELVRERLGPSLSVRVLIEQSARAQSGTVENDLPNVEQSAELLGKAPSTIRTKMQTGEIPAARIGGTWYARRSALPELVPTRR